MELGGEVQQLFRRPFLPREVTRRDREGEKERQLEAMSGSGGATIMMRTDEGAYLGTLSPGEGWIPDAFGPGGLAAFVERDEFDVPRVVVRRLSFR